jgi:hypothetical protein
MTARDVARRARRAAAPILLLYAGACSLLPHLPGFHPAFDEYRTIRSGEPVGIGAFAKQDIVELSSAVGRLQGMPLIVRLDDGVTWGSLADNVSIGEVVARELTPGSCQALLLGLASYHDSVIVGSGSYALPTAKTEFFRGLDLEWRYADSVHAGQDSAVVGLSRLPPGLSTLKVSAVDAIAFNGRIVRGDSIGVLRTKVQGLTSVSREPAYEHDAPRGWTVSFDRRAIDSLLIDSTWFNVKTDAAWSLRSPNLRIAVLQDIDPRSLLDSAYAPLREMPLEAIRSREQEFLYTLDVTRTRAAPVMIVMRSTTDEPCLRTRRDYVLAFETGRVIAGQRHEDVRTEFPFRLERHSKTITGIVGTALIAAFLYFSVF